MNGLEIGRLAERARAGNAAALRKFIALAKEEGFAGAPGGLLYRNGRYTGIRGWQALADRVYYGMVRFSKVENGAVSEG